MKMLLDLYCVFFRIGGLTFGGGLTMLPMLKYELSEKKQWVTEDELLDYYAIGQCTPGIIAVNTSTFVGFKKKGIPGAICSTLGMVSPSLIIITLLALFLERYMSAPIVAHALTGIKIVVCALLLNTVITLAKKSFVSPVCVVIGVLAFGLAMFTPVPAVILVIVAGVFGIVMQKLGRLKL